MRVSLTYPTYELFNFEWGHVGYSIPTRHNSSHTPLINGEHDNSVPKLENLISRFNEFSM